MRKAEKEELRRRPKSRAGRKTEIDAHPPATRERQELGMVESVHQDKGFGFLKGDDGTVRFFHRSGCRRFDHLHPGERVSFVPTRGPKGPRAILVRRLADGPDEEGEGGGEEEANGNRA